MSKITPFLWFNDNAEQAVEFYISIFKNSKVINKSFSAGKVLLVTFELNGQEMLALNGGPNFKFTEAISLYIHCEDQAEVDYYWEKLSADPKAEQCGWLTDKYGLSWQLVPNELGKLMNGKDPIKSKRVMVALLKMKKLDINILKQEYNK